MIKSSLSRIRSSRANGARSRGPKTIVAEQRSSLSALRRRLLVDKEASAYIDSMIAENIRRFGPADGVELGLIKEMATALWRLCRAWTIEITLMDQSVEAAQSLDGVACIAAFSALDDSPQLALLRRYEVRLQGMYQRARNAFLLHHKTKLPNEPRSPSVHSGGTAPESPGRQDLPPREP